MPLLDANIDIARAMFNVNVFAMVSVVQAFAPLLMASKGTVVNIGSIAGKGPFPFQGFYNASKTAVTLLTDNLRVELEPLGVKVILVVTGTVRTRFFENLPASRIPDQSVYASARKEVEYIMSGSVAQQSAIGVDQYAQTVVMNALKRRPTVHHWVGGSVTGVWAVTSFLWHTAWVLTIHDEILDERKKLTVWGRILFCRYIIRCRKFPLHLKGVKTPI